MKKVLCLWLSIIICFLFCGCGQQTTGKEKFEGEAAFLDALDGEWMLWEKSDSRESGVKTILLSKDYSAVLDGESGTWKFAKDPPKDVNNFSITVSLKSGIEWGLFFSRETILGNNITEKTYDKYTLRIGLPKEGFAAESYVNKKDFDTIEITLQNYTQYFEWKEFFVAAKDDFGDFTGGITCIYALAPKDGLKIDSKRSNVEFKFSCTVSVFETEYDVGSDNCRFLDTVAEYDNVYYSTSKFAENSDIGCYSGTISRRDSYQEQAIKGNEKELYTFKVECPDNVNVSAIRGKIYLCKR